MSARRPKHVFRRPEGGRSLVARSVLPASGDRVGRLPFDEGSALPRSLSIVGGGGSVRRVGGAFEGLGGGPVGLLGRRCGGRREWPLLGTAGRSGASAGRSGSARG